MEEKTDEVIKMYNIPLSFLYILCAVVVVAGVALFGYWWLPGIVNLLQAFIYWFNWFILALRNLVLFLAVVSIIFLIYVSFWKTTGKRKQELSDRYLAAFPPEPPVVSALSCDYMGLSESGNYGNINYNYKEINVPASQAVREVEESNYSYDRVVAVAEVSSKSSYRRTRWEKKAENSRTKVEYRRMESERVRTLQTMNGLSSEQVRMTVETFITEKDRRWQNGAAPQWQNGVVDLWQNGAYQLQNGVVDQWQTGLPQLQNGDVDQWQTGLPQLQNGVGDVQWQTSLPQLQNGDVQWQGSRDDGAGRRHHRSRNHRLVGGSGSTGPGSYLAISN